MACASAAATPASAAARASPLGLHDVAPATTSDAPVGASSIASGILQVDGAPFFPVGFYVHSLDKADWAWMETNGVNTVLTYTNGLKTEKTSSVTADDLAQMGEFLDAAAAHKIKVFFSLKDLYDTKNKGADNAGIVSTIVSAFKNHSALLGWYLNDEYKPDYIPQLEARYHNVSSLDPYHVSYSVEDTGKADTLKLYRNTSDLFGVDPYPWANATLTQDLHAEVEEINGLSAAFSMQPRTDPAVAARLLDLSRLSQQLRAFADHAFLRERTVLEVLDAPTTSDGIKLVHASHFADKGESDGAGVVVVVNGSSEPVHVSVVWNGAITKVKLEAWGVVSCGGRQCAPV
eukprot:COSAG02_NODE_9280_length_2268_cov_339.242047_4_plen_347_part_00